MMSDVIVTDAQEPTMSDNRGNERQPHAALNDPRSTLLPMLIGGLVLIVVGMIAVAALA
jgi:hypothetical protein